MGNAIQKIFRLLKPSVPKKEGADGHHFSHTFQRLKVLCDLGFKPDSICDIGASDGRWSRKCQRVFPEARYFCVDPLDENLSHLAKFSSENSQVSYWHGCLGSRAGTLTMNMDGTGSSILPGHTGNLYGVQKEVSVETLDNLILRGICPQPDFLKLDVQGYELEVLKGATSALRKTQAIILEVSFFQFQTSMPIFHEVVGQLAEYGFVVTDILGLIMRPLDGMAGQCDLLFLQSGHHLRQNNKWALNSTY